MLPRASRTIHERARGLTPTPSRSRILASAPEISSVPSSRKSKRWQRDRMVSGTWCASVVASTNFTCAGGSSKVLRSALNAWRVIMWTSSMM